MQDHPEKHEDQPTVRNLTPVVLVILVMTLVVGVTAVFYARSSTSNTSVLIQTNIISGCRSLFFGEVINSFGNLQIANTEQTAAKSQLDLVTNQGLEASITGNDEALSLIIEEAKVLRERVTEKIDLARKAEAELMEKQLTYVDALEQSINDPEEFVKQCRN